MSVWLCRMAAAVGFLCSIAPQAQASSLFATERGVRPLGRAGAFVAGADDGQSVWMNPAGLADAGDTLSFDGAVVLSPIDYTRQTETRDADGVRRVVEFGKVTGTTAPVPIPSFIYTKKMSDKWTGALSLVIPYGSPRSFPATLNGQPAPQRYADISLDGTALAIVGAHGAYKVSERFRVGAGLQLMVGRVKDHKVLGTSFPDRVAGAPEAPDFDADVTVSAIVVTPSVNAGMTWLPSDHVRVGVSAQAPFYVYAPATVEATLPSTAVIRGGFQEGNTGTVSLWLPPILRAGIEYRTDKSGVGLRVEAAYVREFLSMFDRVRFEPNDISVRDLSILPSPLPVPGVEVRNRTNDWGSYRLGAEYISGRGAGAFTLRGGAQYNEESVANRYTTVNNYGPASVIVTAGLGYQVSDKIRLDAVYAKALDYSVTVEAQNAAVTKDLIYQGNPTQLEAHNGGRYQSSLDVFGLGFHYAMQ